MSPRRPPVLSSLLRNRAGLFLLAGQIAMTLAIVANAAFISQQQLRLMVRPSGLAEASIATVRVTSMLGERIPQAQADADLAALRALPDAVAATRINVLPLADAGWRTSVDRQPMGAPGPARTHSALFYTDEHGPAALGLRLVEGRGFTAQEVGDIDNTLTGVASVALISEALAQVLFPAGSAVGKTVYSRTLQPLRVVGVVERLQSAWPEWDLHEQSLLIAARLHLDNATYVVRSRTGDIDHLRSAIPPALVRVEPARLFGNVMAFAEVRSKGYRSQRALALMLATLIAVLVFITALGIGGTAGFWVASRTQQIGTRRALGARRTDILRHFMFENFLITTAGVAAGAILAYALHHWLRAQFGVPALAWYFVPGAVLVLYALGQLAVLGPALRAAAVPPAVATRGA